LGRFAITYMEDHRMHGHKTNRSMLTNTSLTSSLKLIAKPIIATLALCIHFVQAKVWPPKRLRQNLLPLKDSNRPPKFIVSKKTQELEALKAARRLILFAADPVRRRGARRPHNR